MRIAWASPLPPASSGIADYCAELLPHVAAAGLDFDLFYEGDLAPAGGLGRDFACRQVRELARTACEYDLIVYHLGNSAPHHATIYRTLLEFPGLVVLHEYLLHHLVREITLGAGDAAAYVEELRYSAGETGRRAGQRLLATHYPVDPWSYPLFERVVDRSLAVAVHSDFARRRIVSSRPSARVERLPFALDCERLQLVDAEARRAARRRIGLPDDALVLASFGFVTPHKRLEPALRAFARWANERPEAQFVVCGEVSPHFDFASMVAEIGARGVTVTGRVELDRFHDTMAAADLALNLRYPTAGETSAALLRLLAMGVPTIVSDLGAFSELPDAAVAKVAVDEFEVEHLLALFRRLADDRSLATAMGRAARGYVEREHSAPAAAGAYAELCTALAAGPREVENAVAPLAPWPSDDPRMALFEAVGADLADLGVTDGDEEALAAVAGPMVELGWRVGR